MRQETRSPAGVVRRGFKGIVAATYSPRSLIVLVPLALKSLTAVFGMGTGVTFSLAPPQIRVAGQPIEEQAGDLEPHLADRGRV